MSNSKLATINMPASHYSKGRDGRKIEMITIHHMAGVLSAKQCGNIFQGNREASAHYGIGNDGEIAQYVDEANTAWANGNWDANCKAVTIETSNNKTGGDWTVGDKALNSLIKLVADIAKRNNLGTLVKGKNVTWHSMYCSTTCPGNYLRSKMDYIVSEANKINNNETTTETSISNKKSNEDIANEVIAGKWGNGDARKTALKKAGYDYDEVQAIVNEKLLGKSSNTTTNKKSISTIVDEVIAGKWGNGSERKEKLEKAGYNYSEVQTAVNKKLSGKSTSNKKSNETIANEVIKGLWGNGTDRKNKLTAAGYDYDTIQAIVNKKLQ